MQLAEKLACELMAGRRMKAAEPSLWGRLQEQGGQAWKALRAQPTWVQGGLAGLLGGGLLGGVSSFNRDKEERNTLHNILTGALTAGVAGVGGGYLWDRLGQPLQPPSVIATKEKARADARAISEELYQRGVEEAAKGRAYGPLAGAAAGATLAGNTPSAFQNSAKTYLERVAGGKPGGKPGSPPAAGGLPTPSPVGQPQQLAEMIARTNDLTWMDKLRLKYRNSPLIGRLFADPATGVAARFPALTAAGQDLHAVNTATEDLARATAARDAAQARVDAFHQQSRAPAKPALNAAITRLRDATSDLHQANWDEARVRKAWEALPAAAQARQQAALAQLDRLQHGLPSITPENMRTITQTGRNWNNVGRRVAGGTAGSILGLLLDHYIRKGVNQFKPPGN